MAADNTRKGLSLIFEDSSEVNFRWAQVKDLCIEHCSESIGKIGEELVFISNFESAHIKISPTNNDERKIINSIYHGMLDNDSNEITQLIIGGVRVVNANGITTELTYHTSSPNSYIGMHEDVSMEGDDLIIDIYY